METDEYRLNNIVRGIITSLFTLFIFGLVFFSNVTYVSAKTFSEKSAKDYTLSLQEKEGIKEQITGAEISLKYDSTVPESISYDENLLNERINKLQCFDTSKVIQSQNAKLVYENNSFVIYKEIYGNSINRNALYENIVKAIKNRETEINLEELKCYEEPKFVTTSPEIVSAKETLNRYISAKITYNFAGQTRTLDGVAIKDWIIIGEDYEVSLYEPLVRKYVDSLADAYTSLLGTSIKVSGGYDGNNHSWIINREAETSALIENIKNGQTIEKHPIYAQTSAANYFRNVGGTFVEIDMTKQHLWYYKDGYLVVEGDVVTGNANAGHSTPAGVYRLYYKQKDTVLRGEDYAAPVSFWMPFNGNIGLHDANWRSDFGGEIYKTDGSHGCVNAPYYVAKAVYNNINSGVAVICYNS